MLFFNCSFDLIDVNECLYDKGGCGQTCSNTIGSYECSCDNGYLLIDDHDCEGIVYL